MRQVCQSIGNGGLTWCWVHLPKILLLSHFSFWLRLIFYDYALWIIHTLILAFCLHFSKSYDIFTSPYLYTHIGVPILSTPCSTSTPITIGSLFLKVWTCLRIQGKIAYLPYLTRRSYLTEATCLVKKSVKW